MPVGGEGRDSIEQKQRKERRSSREGRGGRRERRGGGGGGMKGGVQGLRVGDEILTLELIWKVVHS